MRARKRFNNMQFGRLLSGEQVRAYLSMGRDKAIRFAKECGACRKVGRMVRYDREVIDAWLDTMSEEQKEGKA